MKRYFFHLFNDTHTRDEDGVELPDDAAAVERARSEARTMAIASLTEHGHLILHHKIVVEDQTGTEVAVVHFRDVVTVQD